ncbi:hypothetical protein SELMODRAFT_91876 [Selaginella moellendorffii]|uniref:Immediate early response 3-interacting protein 1 n=1 Tax=Selaginella moellendorffii TaxID=88036 RepID=D8REP0_SELML|nr:immediate early response 3-interacting protein 1 [Selaginella moellendorffii]EFJ28047.1 hypothetical protein SELMODRAFT_94503 [Selaginella moellendorffii]EFJ29473.1 hypothetical protein SELMODRAFT_91876 [Selaginella moellendorffii]|eukprot:XP_002969385.1 immediate early response 3-interacting protein 1 [Selaginella moellendorffii]
MWILLEAVLLMLNSIAILNEERFLAPHGWGFGDMSQHGSQTLKGQIIGFIHAVQYLRMPLIFFNLIAITSMLLFG